MNPVHIVSSHSPAELRLPRSVPATDRTPEEQQALLREDQRRLQEDLAALREREENLRAYEARLRGLQQQTGHGPSDRPGPTGRSPSHAPFHDEANLSTAWSKLHRARELLEAEQRNLRDDRLTLTEEKNYLAKRERELAIREARVAEGEKMLQVKVQVDLKRPTGIFGFSRPTFFRGLAAKS
ncbi:MAG: hypothetical protein ACHQ4G_00845 [Opitutales bacterium]